MLQKSLFGSICKMDETIINQEIAKLDLQKVAALQQKRSLAFVNHFVITTVQILNNFMKNCEQRLMNLQRKLEKIEAAVVLLESRLSSIPEVNTKTEVTLNEDKPDAQVAEVEQNNRNQSEDHNEAENKSKVESAEPQIQPEYVRFVKMVQVGVPIQAVKLKVSLEGLDPTILEKILNK